MFAGRLASLKVFGGGGSSGSTLDADLRKVTESGVIEIPKELLNAVTEATQNEDDRRTIMAHLRECLAEPSGKRWRRVHAALCLAEDLMKNGTPELLVETAEGRHFDLVQRLSLLQHFECTTDRRVQNMVRTKATTLRNELVPRLETASESAPRPEPAAESREEKEPKESKESKDSKDAKDSKDCQSACNADAASVASCSTAASTGAPPWMSYSGEKQAGQMILNGIVAVGHRDDTTSESSGDEAPRRPVAYRKHRQSAPKQEAPAPAPAPAPSPSPAPTWGAAQFTDLLGL